MPAALPPPTIWQRLRARLCPDYRRRLSNERLIANCVLENEAAAELATSALAVGGDEVVLESRGRCALASARTNNGLVPIKLLPVVTCYPTTEYGGHVLSNILSIISGLIRMGDGATFELYIDPGAASYDPDVPAPQTMYGELVRLIRECAIANATSCVVNFSRREATISVRLADKQVCPVRKVRVDFMVELVGMVVGVADKALYDWEFTWKIPSASGSL